MGDDVLIAQLAPMFPNHDIHVLAQVVGRAKAAFNQNEVIPEALFNFCVDHLLQLVDGEVEGAYVLDVDNYGQADRGGGDQPVNKRQRTSEPSVDDSADAVDLPGPSNANARIDNAVKSVLKVSSSSNVPVVGGGEPEKAEIPKMKIDPDKKVAPGELCFYVDHVKEMFPNVERKWVYDHFANGSVLSMIVETIVTRSGEVPKEKKPEKKSPTVINKVACRTNKDYFLDIEENVSLAYASVALKLLMNEFRLISQVSLTAVLNQFNKHYAPAMKALRHGLKNLDLRKSRGNAIVLTVAGNIDVVIHVNKTRRAPYANIQTIPDELQVEIEWMNERIYDDEPTTLSSGLLSVTDFSGDASTSAMQREQVLLEARERGELFECVICCDEFLIYEMNPCTEGHLFCSDCLRNHAREIVYGQAKATIVCLEGECKAGFSRETLIKALDAQWIEKLEERQLEENVNCADIEGLVRCKYCNFAVVMDVPVEQNKVFKCANSECEREVCRLCGTDWDEHVGLRCEELENADETKLRREMEEKMAETVIRACFKCKAKMIKADGCNKMTCRCGAKMCYICREPNIDYNHFCNHARNPGKACDKCNACSLWEDAAKIDNSKLNELKQEAQVAQESLGTGNIRLIGVDETKFNPPQQPGPNRMQYPPPFAAPNFALYNQPQPAQVANVNNAYRGRGGAHRH